MFKYEIFHCKIIIAKIIHNIIIIIYTLKKSQLRTHFCDFFPLHRSGFETNNEDVTEAQTFSNECLGITAIFMHSVPFSKPYM